jgi:hypothetical protein
VKGQRRLYSWRGWGMVVVREPWRWRVTRWENALLVCRQVGPFVVFRSAERGAP